MYDLRRAYNNITLEEIRSKVSDYELWKKYCKNFQEVNKPFLSELYNDRNPSCRIFYNNGRLLYKDFGNEGVCYDPIEYIIVKYNCTFMECLNIICADFNLTKSKITIDRSVRVHNIEETLLIKPRSKIDIVPQTFNVIDYEYWNQYHIPLTLLQEYNVFSARYVYLYKNDRTITFCYTPNNPIYAYRFVDEEDRLYNYKIYKPYEQNRKYKWLFSGKHTDIEGYDQLSLNGDLLILTKSLKDCMVYRLLGYDAISLQGEANRIESSFVNKLYRRFNKIIVNYDYDEEGIRGSMRMNTQYNFDYFFIDKPHKDISDYVKNNGLNKGKILVDEKIRQLR